MDLASFALGLAAGVIVAVLALTGFVMWKVRRIARRFPIRAGFHGVARLRPSGVVETDAEDNILPPSEAR